MKHGSTLFLKLVIALIGIAVIVLCVFMFFLLPEAGEYLPIILGMYAAAVPFFFGLYQALKLLNYIDKDMAFSDLSVRAIKNIKYSTIGISTLFAVGMPYIAYVAEKDDAPGVIAIGLAIIFASIVVATFAAVLQKLLHNAIDIKSENEFTV